ncbi:DUF2867 domain-containing protein [Tateyamaria sp. ANG-S1]|uniref:DUF2867 domain-containing protein n=1 Tax=Tateyamaria sp. ANG-S1 TaxID=1577905 RepID=UPI00057F56EB|nr:DUF2867 domain-containing protein [Tateyamaria sp. ANG-S1]KIC50331.1 hypothetical protein RA29_06330 [Tateyamaria sp. ANG-S1]
MSAPRVTATRLSSDSVLHNRMGRGDFLDCYSVANAASPRTAAQIITAFPGWAQVLVKLRGLITSPFGLSQDGPEAADKLGPFPVESDTGTELIAGFDDKHLDFRVSVRSENGTVSLATWVHPHNVGGRIYLAAIMPFHILIARNALARVARAPQTPPHPV